MAIVALGELGIGIRLLGPSKTWLDLTEPIGRWAYFELGKANFGENIDVTHFLLRLGFFS